MAENSKADVNFNTSTNTNGNGNDPLIRSNNTTQNVFDSPKKSTSTLFIKTNSSNKNKTFLDRLPNTTITATAATTQRANIYRNKDKNLISPTNRRSDSFIYNSHMSGGDFSNSNRRTTFEESCQHHHLNNNRNSSSVNNNHNSHRGRKWFSFSNLLNRQHLNSILNIPNNSRLSVSSTITSVFSGGGVLSTPNSPNDNEEEDTRFYEDKYQLINKTHSKRPPSPSPSCATISGEYPSRSRFNFNTGGGGAHFNNSSVVFRQKNNYSAKYKDNNINNNNNKNNRNSSSILFTSSSLNKTNCSHSNSRLSCGEFFPITPTSPGTASSNEFYNNNINTNFDNSLYLNAKYSIGRSLPSLLEAMETVNSSGSPEGSLRRIIGVESVVDLLYEEFAILTGAKTKDDHYLIIFPDRGNFHLLPDEEYKRLILYLISLPPLHDAESGFVIIIDRRNDKWNSVKSVLIRISSFFPGLIHRVFVLRPVGFLQKALSEVSSKLFRTDNFRFPLTVCNNLSNLTAFIDLENLTTELGGLLLYNKVRWVQQRVEVEAFGHALRTLSRDLKLFTESFQDFECPNNVSTIEMQIQDLSEEFERLKDDLSQALIHGEGILNRVKGIEEGGGGDPKFNRNSIQLINVISVERYIIQIEETSRLFKEFWGKEKIQLEQCKLLRAFEQDFRELQATFDLNVKSLNALEEMGENLKATDKLIVETLNLQQTTLTDLQRAINVELNGRDIVATNPSAVDSVEPKCVELSRMTSQFRFAIEEKIDKQHLWRKIQSTIEDANSLCSEGLDLIGGNGNGNQESKSNEDVTDFSTNILQRIDEFLTRLQSQIELLTDLKNSLTETAVAQCRNVVKQVLKRVEDVQIMIAKRRSILYQQRSKLRRNSGGSNLLTFASSMENVSEMKSARSTSHLDEGLGVEYPNCSQNLINSSNTNTLVSIQGSISAPNGKFEENSESKKVKRNHVLKELLDSEKTYVNEIQEILKGYRDQTVSDELKSILPVQLKYTNALKRKSLEENYPPNVSVLFCNLDEIFSFHSKIFLPDLNNCIQSLELVGLCFIQRNSEFLTMYSKYCQLLPGSESLRKEIGENHPWFVACKNKIGHKLGIGAYLLKPVQRITKYHLLLKDLVKYSAGCEVGFIEAKNALEYMLIVLRCVNDGMHQLSISGYPTPLQNEGPLLLQGPFLLWTETKNRLRLKGHQRYIFLYQKTILICKKSPKSASYEFKNKLNVSEIGLTEALKGSGATRKFEIWVQGRQKVFVLQAETQEIKDIWVREIKRLLMEQLEFLRHSSKGNSSSSKSRLIENNTNAGINFKRNKMMGQKGITVNGWRSTAISHSPLRQVSSWDSDKTSDSNSSFKMQMKTNSAKSEYSDVEEEPGWSSDVTNSDDDDLVGPTALEKVSNEINSITNNSIYGNGENIENGPKFTVLADYNGSGTAEISLKEGDIVTLLKVGVGGWWFVQLFSSIPDSTTKEGWAPLAYLEPFKKPSCSSSESGNEICIK